MDIKEQFTSIFSRKRKNHSKEKSKRIIIRKPSYNLNLWNRKYMKKYIRNDITHRDIDLPNHQYLTKT